MLKGGILDDIIISYLHMGIFDKVSDDISLISTAKLVLRTNSINFRFYLKLI